MVKKFLFISGFGFKNPDHFYWLLEQLFVFFVCFFIFHITWFDIIIKNIPNQTDLQSSKNKPKIKITFYPNYRTSHAIFLRTTQGHSNLFMMRTQRQLKNLLQSLCLC